MATEAEQLRARILKLVADYHRAAFPSREFVPGKSAIPVSGRVFGTRELQFLVEASLDFWLTTGRFNEAFEKRLREFLGVKHVLTTNSGSSANLLALSALTSHRLGVDRLKQGDEVITVAAGFPTTVNPIFQNGMVPVFVDLCLPTYNILSDLIEPAISAKTRAIVLAHTLGNPFNLKEVLPLAEKHNLWVVEDCCDALGSEYPRIDGAGGHEEIYGKCGTFGHIATFSFYPAHHITMGEGGAVATNDSRLKQILESFRDWGRDCWCPPGHDNTCGRRFERQYEHLPLGYDHKYVYGHAGYNLKITDMQAAVGLAQMDRLEAFIQVRQLNFDFLTKGMQKLAEYLILPQATLGSLPSWFGYPLTIRDGDRFPRQTLLQYLDKQKIGSRLLFGGNLTKQPYFQGRNYRVFGELDNTDIVMKQTFWLGLYPGLTEPMLEFMISRLNYFFNK